MDPDLEVASISTADTTEWLTLVEIERERERREPKVG